MSTIDKLIEMQEFKDRSIAAWILKDCCTGENLRMWKCARALISSMFMKRAANSLDKPPLT